MTARTLADKIRAQAAGTYPTEASALLITTALGGRLVDQLPLAWHGDRMAEIDWAAARETTGYLSGGERRILDLADSLFTGHPINLADALSGLDDHNARTVLQAVAHCLQVPIHRQASR